MPILGTQASGFFEPPVYSLALTANTTQNYTIPAGVNLVAFAGAGAGGGGGAVGDSQTGAK